MACHGLHWQVACLLRFASYGSLSRLLLVLFNALGFYFSYRSAVGECAGSCSVVTESPAGKLFGYSLSVIGVAYFGVSLLPTLFIPAWMHVWNWIAIVALLMPVWSIAHQAFVLHAWCKNCMVVQLMVILSAIVVMAGDVCSGEAFTVQPLVALPSFYLLAVYLHAFFRKLLSQVLCSILNQM